MSEVLQANVFFVITAVAVVVVTVLIGVVLYHIIHILRAVRDITERVRKGSEVFAEDVSTLHMHVTQGIKPLGRIFSGISDKVARRRKKKKEDVLDKE